MFICRHTFFPEWLRVQRVLRAVLAETPNRQDGDTWVGGQHMDGPEGWMMRKPSVVDAARQSRMFGVEAHGPGRWPLHSSKGPKTGHKGPKTAPNDLKRWQTPVWSNALPMMKNVQMDGTFLAMRGPI